MEQSFRHRVAGSPVARGAALPLRTAMVARYDARLIGRSFGWLVRDRETTNMTYDLAPLNRDQLAWFVSAVTGATVGQAREWMSELEHDDALLGHLRERLASNPRKGVNAREPHWGRRLGWYAIVRATRPETVVETGTALGLGSCVLAAALLRNGRGRLTTIDIEPETGHLIGGEWASVTDRRIGSSVEILADVGPVDLFLHDSLHTYEFEASEFAAVEPHLSPDAVVLSDNSHDSAALPDWAERTGRRYLFFKEEPRDHWWPGDGIGAAWGHAD